VRVLSKPRRRERRAAQAQADAHLARRLVWALVHSPMETDVRRGRALAQELLAGKQLEERSEHDCIYLLSVALYRAGRLLDARRQLDELLKVRAPGWAHHVHRVSSAGSSTRQFWCVSAECLRPTPDTGCVRRKRGKAPPHRRSRPTLHQGTYHAALALCVRALSAGCEGPQAGPLRVVPRTAALSEQTGCRSTLGAGKGPRSSRLWRTRL